MTVGVNLGPTRLLGCEWGHVAPGGPQAAGSLQASSIGFALLAASRADAALS